MDGRFKHLGITYDISLVLSQYLFLLVECLGFSNSEWLRKNYRGYEPYFPKVYLIMLAPLGFTVCKLCSYLVPNEASLNAIRVIYEG